MPSTFALVVVAAVVLSVIAGLVRLSRRSQKKRAFDAGSVSTRWISELRRDEPWTGR